MRWGAVRTVGGAQRQCLGHHDGLAGGSEVKNLLAVQETWVWSRGWEDPLEEERATHSSIPAWEISWTKEPGRRVHEVARVRHNLVTNQQQRPPHILHGLYFYSLLEELGSSSTIQYFQLAEWGSGMGTLFPVMCPKGIFHEDPSGYAAV